MCFFWHSYLFQAPHFWVYGSKFWQTDAVAQEQVDRFRGLAVYVRDVFSAEGKRSYDSGCCEIMVVRICSSRHNIYVFGVSRNQDILDKILDCWCRLWLRCNPWIEKRLSVCECLSSERECLSWGFFWIPLQHSWCYRGSGWLASCNHNRKRDTNNSHGGS